jgi:hypothetical protein
MATPLSSALSGLSASAGRRPAGCSKMELGQIFGKKWLGISNLCSPTDRSLCSPPNLTREARS